MGALKIYTFAHPLTWGNKKKGWNTNVNSIFEQYNVNKQTRMLKCE
jgi:hypothetical protein